MVANDLIATFQRYVFRSASEMKGDLFVDPYEMQGVFNARLGSDPEPAVDTTAPPPPSPAPPAAQEVPAVLDAGKNATLYVVPYAHLDTEWRWEYPTVIGEYLSRTMRDNFALFEKYPHFVFNFSGANRYRFMKEYYPADYQKIQKYVAVEMALSPVLPRRESTSTIHRHPDHLRQILYAEEFFRHDFGRTSAEYMLPDCFGFPASLPSILSHTGIKGFYPET